MKFKYILAIAIFGLIPSDVFGANIYLESSRTNISVGDVVIVSVKIDSEGEVLNTVEGEISLNSDTPNLVVDQFSLANSSFGLWPRSPSLSNNAKKISFVGGVPGGFSIEGATLFKIIMEAKQVGQITLDPENFSVYLNDGMGNKVPAKTKKLVINITPSGENVQNDWINIVRDDKTPPEDFIIVLGQDPNLYDGKKFAFFSAVDNQTGIDHYEVRENGNESVRSGSTYVLQNQKREVDIEVVAYDKAGNKKVAKLGEEKGVSVPTLVTILLVVIILIFIFKKRK